MHACVDLYKYAMWFQPLVGSELAADCFELARQARNLDMQASPYDVSYVGLEPIRVETADGRREYAAAQKALMATSTPLRSRLSETLSALSPRRS